MKKIYIGCSLTFATDEYKSQIEKLKDSLRSDFEILDFVGLINGTPTDVFKHDTSCVKNCDVFIAECSYPSIGLGYEIGIALENNNKTIILIQNQAKVTRLVLGVPKNKATIVFYDAIEEIINTIKNYI